MNRKTKMKIIDEKVKQEIYKQQRANLIEIQKDNLWFGVRVYAVIIPMISLIVFCIWSSLKCHE